MSEYSKINYKPTISNAAIIKIPEMLRLVPDHLKTKKMCKDAVKKLPFIIGHVTDWCKTQQSCDVITLLQKMVDS